jgi:hypothetical protein
MNSIVGKNIQGMAYSFENYRQNPISISGKIIDKVVVPFKHELEVIPMDAYVVASTDGYVFTVLPMDVQKIFNQH